MHHGRHLLLKVDEEVEEGGQDVSLPMREEVAQAALLRRRLAGFRQRQRVLQLLEDAPAARQSWGYARLALPATCCFAGCCSATLRAHTL